MINNESITAYIDKLFTGTKLPVKLRTSILLFLFTAMKAFALISAFVGRMIDEKYQRRGIKRNYIKINPSGFNFPFPIMV
ncbi:MAG: hypothetical protein A2096_14420 [Spirochaetes bacterium GWF1_41_5]|nr:MAG: hypothetical protein A2096_14420 [Spirochaetes bacterium GWF1_41_5]